MLYLFGFMLTLLITEVINQLSFDADEIASGNNNCMITTILELASYTSIFMHTLIT